MRHFSLRHFPALDYQTTKLEFVRSLNTRALGAASTFQCCSSRPPEKRAFFQIEKSQFGLVSRPKSSMISVTAVEKPSVAWPAAKVEIWPIERLTANPRNARIHGPEQIEQIRASLREFGWTMPVLVRENGMLIAGHGRLEAAKLEGITEVPTIVARGWSEAQCQAYAIADNN